MIKIGCFEFGKIAYNTEKNYFAAFYGINISGRRFGYYRRQSIQALVQRCMREALPEELEEQRHSFTYGNCSIDKPGVTREVTTASWPLPVGLATHTGADDLHDVESGGRPSARGRRAHPRREQHGARLRGRHHHHGGARYPRGRTDHCVRGTAGEEVMTDKTILRVKLDFAVEAEDNSLIAKLAEEAR